MSMGVAEGSYRCDGCGRAFDVHQFLDACSGYWSVVGAVSFRCSSCGATEDVQVWPGSLRLGYIYAAGAPHFAAETTWEVPDVWRRKTGKALEVGLGEKTWLISSLQ